MDNSRKVSEIMDRKLVAVSKTTSIATAVKLIKTSGVNALPVLEDGKLVGVVGEDELLDFIANHDEGMRNQSVITVSKKPVFAEQNDPVSKAIHKLVDNRLTRLPIVDSAGSMLCVGIVSASELLKEASK